MMRVSIFSIFIILYVFCFTSVFTLEATAKKKGSSMTELLDPKKATDKAPDTFTVLFETTKGSFKVKAYPISLPQWSG